METSHETGTHTVLVQVITGGCCGPTTSPFDDRVEAVVRQAVAEAGVPADLRCLSMSEAFYGAVPPAIIERFSGEVRSGGKNPLPVVLINGEVASSGVLPELEQLKSQLVHAAAHAANNPKERTGEE